MKIRFLFAWYDLWMGLFWDRKARKLYILPIPMFGIVVTFKQKWTPPTSSESTPAFQGQLLSLTAPVRLVACGQCQSFKAEVAKPNPESLISSHLR